MKSREEKKMLIKQLYSNRRIDLELFREHPLQDIEGVVNKWEEKEEEIKKTQKIFLEKFSDTTSAFYTERKVPESFKLKLSWVKALSIHNIIPTPNPQDPWTHIN